MDWFESLIFGTVILIMGIGCYGIILELPSFLTRHPISNNQIFFALVFIAGFFLLVVAIKFVSDYIEKRSKRKGN